MSTIELTSPQARPKLISNSVIGIVLFIITEIMFFAGLISSYLVNRAGATQWPPANQPRLPIEITGVNTGILMLSGLFFIVLLATYTQKQKLGKLWLGLSMLTGLIFVGIQGYEWIQLIGFGLTTTSSVYGAFFYSLIGMHGLHVLIGIFLLIYLWFSMGKNAAVENTKNKIVTVGIFWFFVVAIWPVLYYMVYLY
jgi:heme/copper-type cytochrome/quinol oxidase subunit 3